MTNSPAFGVRVFRGFKPLAAVGLLAKYSPVWLAFGLACCLCEASAESAGKVDFAKEVLPLFRDNCLDCHGPTKQKAGLRLDRRSSVMKAFSRRVQGGSSANSMVYHRLIGNEYGMQ